MVSKGLDFSRMNVKATRESLKTGGRVVYKDDYYNSGNTKSSTEEKTKRDKNTTLEMRVCISLAIRNKLNYDGLVELMESKGLRTVKEKYWTMILRTASYGEDVLNSWVSKPRGISYYIKNFGV